MVPILKRCLETMEQINSKIENNVTNALKEILQNMVKLRVMAFKT